LSYPFTRGKNWNEFIEEMKGIGVEFINETVTGPDGAPIAVTYFRHKMDGKTIRHVVDIGDRSEILMPSTVKIICRALQIHPRVFGLTLG
jgi:hypothetical protein